MPPFPFYVSPLHTRLTNYHSIKNASSQTTALLMVLQRELQIPLAMPNETASTLMGIFK